MHPVLGVFEKAVERDFRTQMVGYRKSYSNLSNTEGRLLDEISKDSILRVMKPDKGGGAVIMDRLLYVTGIFDILAQSDKYQVASRNKVNIAYKKG